MHIGISSLIFNLKDAINLCKEHDKIKHIEVGLDNLEECDTLLKYKEIFKSLNISIGIHLPMELNTCENVSFIRYKWIDFIENMNIKLKDLNIKYYNMHLGYAMTNRLKNSKNKYLDNSIDFLNKLKLDKNILLTIENTYTKYGDFSNLGNKSYDFEYIFSNIENNKIGFCYDTGHFLIDKDNYIEKLSKNVSIIHLSDNDGKEDSHLGIGKGILNIEHVNEILNLNPQYLILEVKFDHISDTIKKLK